jgi:hypothetical protein
MTFEIEIPEQIIILDPRVSEDDETYARIVEVTIVYGSGLWCTFCIITLNIFYSG